MLDILGLIYLNFNYLHFINIYFCCLELNLMAAEKFFIIQSTEDLESFIDRSLQNRLPPILRAAIKSALESLKTSDERMTRAQTKEFLDCSYVSLWNWEKKGWVKPIRMGKKVFYLKSQLIDFMSNQK
jgi:hypothetical protein